MANDIPLATLEWKEHNASKSTLTIDEIRKLVADIEAIADDDENAHVLEDAMLWKFVRHVSEKGDEREARIAKEVLRSLRIDFGRWCS